MKEKEKNKKPSKFIFIEMLKHEFFDSITSHPIKIIRFLGILFIPFLYGFVYIFAFNNPLDKTNKLDFTMLISQKQSQDPIFKKIAAVMNENDGSSINVSTKVMSSADIYNQEKLREEVEKHYVSFVISGLKDTNNKEITLGEWFKQEASDLLKLNIIDKPIETATNFIKKLLDSAQGRGSIKMYFNNKKNFLIAFGASTKAATNVIYLKAIDAFLRLDDASLIKLGITPAQIAIIKPVFKKVQELMGKVSNIAIIKNNAQMSEHSQYGFGLAPFFIGMGLWVGSLAALLFINGKVYRKDENKTKLYFVKLLMVFVTNIIQTTILFLSLMAIGFLSLGPPFAFMYFSALIISLLFTIIVFSIRFIVPSRVAGIIIVVFFLIAQMATYAGLFPNFAQSKFFEELAKIMPLKYAIVSLREAMFETNYLRWLEYIGILWTITIPFQIIGPIIYTIRKNKEFPIKAVA